MSVRRLSIAPVDLVGIPARRRPGSERMERVGPASRLAIERALEDDGLSLVEARLLLSQLWNLTTWSLMSDSLYRAELLERARVDVRHGRRALAANHDRGSIGWRGARGAGRRSTIWLPGGDSNRPLIGLAEKGAAAAPFGPKKGGAQSPKKGAPGAPLPGTRDIDVKLFEPEASDRRCYIDGCADPVAGSYATHWFCSRHLEEQFGQ